MSHLTEDLKSLKNGLPPAKLASVFHQKGIVFVHVPKCAGTSIETALRRTHRISRFIINPSASFDAAERELGIAANDSTRQQILQKASEIRRSNLQYALSTGFRCITGHAPLGVRTIDAWKDDYAFVTVLRDPIRRYKSHLAFNYSNGSGHGKVEEPLDRFLERERAQTMGALFVKYFSGLPMDADFRSAEAIELSKNAIRKMDVIGFTDKLDLFAQQIKQVIGKQIKIGHENKTSIEPLDLSDAQLEKIEHLCAPDLEIWNWARKEFGAD